jgi:hypothetical protein
MWWVISGILFTSELLGSEVNGFYFFPATFFLPTTPSLFFCRSIIHSKILLIYFVVLYRAKRKSTNRNENEVVGEVVGTFVKFSCHNLS